MEHCLTLSTWNNVFTCGGTLGRCVKSRTLGFKISVSNVSFLRVLKIMDILMPILQGSYAYKYATNIV